MLEIPLAGGGLGMTGLVALIDDGDLELVSAYRWKALVRRDGGLRLHGPYARTNLIRDGRTVQVLMHKFLTGWPQTDHIDHNGLNNQRSNLRPTTTARNNHNQRPQLGTSSRYKGVTWHKKLSKWQAAIKLNGHCIYLGVFASEEAAAAAYDIAAREAYGEHAYLNGVAA